jgi:hypothetical protein
VFTARYALSPYIKQIRFVFKGLMQPPWMIAEKPAAAWSDRSANGTGASVHISAFSAGWPQCLVTPATSNLVFDCSWGEHHHEFLKLSIASVRMIKECMEPWVTPAVTPLNNRGWKSNEIWKLSWMAGGENWRRVVLNGAFCSKWCRNFLFCYQRVYGMFLGAEKYSGEDTFSVADLCRWVEAAAAHPKWWGGGGKLPGCSPPKPPKTEI